MNTHRLTRTHPITPELVVLQRLVPESQIQYEDEDTDAIPFCTVDGKRQVISMPDMSGYDLWVPRRNPKPGDAVTCSDFGVSIEQAIAFLTGAPLTVVRAITHSNEFNHFNKELLRMAVDAVKSNHATPGLH